MTTPQPPDPMNEMDEALALEIVANRERIAASRGVEIMTRLRVIPTNQNWPYCVSAAEFYILALKHERERTKALVEAAETRVRLDTLREVAPYIPRTRNSKWKTVLRGAMVRCNPEPKKSVKWKHYGGKGIRCLLTMDEICFLWFRDRGYLLARPSIDRIDSSANYTLENCRFIELSENSGRATRRTHCRRGHPLDGDGADVCLYRGRRYCRPCRREVDRANGVRSMSEAGWNSCDECARFIPLADFASGAALRELKTPDSEFTAETYTTLCKKHREKR